MSTIIYTDGSCSPNPGNGGWAAIIFPPDGNRYTIYGGERDTTNNRMELTAVIKALERIDDKSVVIYTDSHLIIKCAMAEWKMKKNLDLWKQLIPLIQRNVKWEYIRGHSDNPINDEVDNLANMGRVMAPTQDQHE